jgi:predicted murein hydrolase (TIGR00659 family)
MKALFESQTFVLLLIFTSFLLGQWVFKRTRIPFLHPLITAMAIIIGYIKLAGMPIDEFMAKSEFVNYMLGPSVVALGYLLHKQIDYLKGNVFSILTSVFIGSIVGIFSVILLAKLTGADKTLIASLEPKSVTTPIALAVAEQAGGIPSLTAVAVMFCGILGSIMGPYVLKLLRIESSIAKGLAMGASSHAVGTAKAMEMGVIEGAISGLAIGLMGVMTALMIPVFNQFL